MAKEPTQWETKTIKEVMIGKSVWRSQTLKSGDGKEMLSVRKFAKRANGELQVTNSGLTISIDEDTASTIEALTALLTSLKSHSPGGKKPKPAAKAAPEEEADEDYYVRVTDEEGTVAKRIKKSVAQRRYPRTEGYKHFKVKE